MKSQRKRLFKRKKGLREYQQLVLAGRLCVYSDVCNVYGKDLVLLRQPVMSTCESYVNKMIEFWNIQRNKIGIFPPSGWPLSFVLTTIAVFTATIDIITSYVKILKTKMMQSKTSKHHHVLTTAFQYVKKN